MVTLPKLAMVTGHFPPFRLYISYIALQVQIEEAENRLELTMVADLKYARSHTFTAAEL